MSSMKSRLSFVTRRPSAVPSFHHPTSPKGEVSKEHDEDGAAFPIPEPMNTGITPRPSELGRIPEIHHGASGALATTTMPLRDSDTSPTPTLVKGRSKSGADLKKKSSSALDEASENIFPTSVREGFLKKKGVINVLWKKRYIVLLPHQLAYYDEIPTSHTAQPKGFINLTSILKVVHHDVSNFSFDVVTPTRIFRLQADTQADMDAWIASISGTAANEQQIIASKKRNMSHAALRGLTEEDRLKGDDSAKISHENAELSQWPKWNAFEVAAWLQTFGMARYCADFYNAGVTGESFKTMDENTLKTIMPEGEKTDRVKILAQIKKLMHT